MAGRFRKSTITQHLGTLLCPKHHFMVFPDHSRPVWDFCMTIPVYFPCKSWMAGTLTGVRVPAILKKFIENVDFQYWVFGPGLALQVTFGKFSKINHHDPFRKSPYSASKPANYPQPGMLRMVDLSRNPGFATPLGRGNIMGAPIWRG